MRIRAGIAANLCTAARISLYGKTTMSQSPQKILGLNALFRAAAILALWPKCFDPKAEAYTSRDPTARV